MLTKPSLHYSLSLVGIFCLSIFISACVDKIDFVRPETIEDGIAIQGKLLKGSPSFISVSIQKTLDFKSSTRFINASSVTLLDTEGNAIDLDSRVEGIFFKDILDNDPNISIEFGKSYKIRVETFDNRVFESAFEALLPVPTPTNLTVKRITKKSLNPKGEVISNDNFLSFEIETPLEATPNSGKTKLLWELEGTYKISDTPELYDEETCIRIGNMYDGVKRTCYLNISPTENFISLDGTKLSVSKISESIYEPLISSTFSEGYYLSVFQQSLTDKAFEYWSQVSKVLVREGNIFEAPAGKIVTNIKNLTNPEEESFGYFYATEAKNIRVFVSPELAGNPSDFCPRMLNLIGQAQDD